MPATFTIFKKSPVAAKSCTKPCFLMVTKWAYTQNICYLNLANDKYSSSVRFLAKCLRKPKLLEF